MIYTCKSLDEMIDLVQAWREGKFEAVREAIRANQERQPMEQKQYDNSNQLALWHPKDSDKRKGYYVGGGDKQGRDNFNGQPIYDAVLTVIGAASPKAPFAKLWWETDGGVYTVPIFRNDGDNLGGSTESHWVNLYKNNGGKGPVLRVKFKEKQPVGAAVSHDEPVEHNDIPF